MSKGSASEPGTRTSFSFSLGTETFSDPPGLASERTKVISFHCALGEGSLAPTFLRITYREEQRSNLESEAELRRLKQLKKSYQTHFENMKK